LFATIHLVRFHQYDIASSITLTLSTRTTQMLSLTVPVLHDVQSWWMSVQSTKTVEKGLVHIHSLTFAFFL